MQIDSQIIGAFIGGIFVVIGIVATAFGFLIKWLVKTFKELIDENKKAISDVQKTFSTELNDVRDELKNFFGEFKELKGSELNCQLNTNNEISNIYQIMENNRLEAKDDLVKIDSELEKKIDSFKKEFSDFKKEINKKFSDLTNLIMKLDKDKK